MTEKAVKFGAFMSKMLCHEFLPNISSGKMVEVHSENAPKIGHNWKENAHTCPDILATPEASFAWIYMRFFLLESP